MKKKYADWARYQIESLQLVENRDFVVFPNFEKKLGFAFTLSRYTELHCLGTFWPLMAELGSRLDRLIVLCGCIGPDPVGWVGQVRPGLGSKALSRLYRHPWVGRGTQGFMELANQDTRASNLVSGRVDG
jgi:hypothetical protein